MRNDPIAKGLAITLAFVALLASAGCDTASGADSPEIVINSRFAATASEVNILDRSGDVRARFERTADAEVIVETAAGLEGAALHRYADGLLHGFTLIIVNNQDVELILEVTG